MHRMRLQQQGYRGYATTSTINAIITQRFHISFNRWRTTQRTMIKRKIKKYLCAPIYALWAQLFLGDKSTSSS